MEYRGIRYSIVQAGAAFKWTAHLATGDRIGEAPNRSLAIIQALQAIDKQQRETRAALAKNPGGGGRKGRERP